MKSNVTHTWTFDIHEIRVGALNQSFELALSPLLLLGWVKQIFCKLKHRKKRDIENINMIIMPTQSLFLYLFFYDQTNNWQKKYANCRQTTLQKVALKP
jgi:hypothetical protein